MILETKGLQESWQASNKLCARAPITKMIARKKNPAAIIASPTRVFSSIFSPRRSKNLAQSSHEMTLLGSWNWTVGFQHQIKVPKQQMTVVRRQWRMEYER
jgi:hypothetical protein